MSKDIVEIDRMDFMRLVTVVGFCVTELEDQYPLGHETRVIAKDMSIGLIALMEKYMGEPTCN